MTLFAPPTSPDLWRPKHTPFARPEGSLFGLQEKGQEVIDADYAHLGRNHGPSIVLFMGRRGEGKTVVLTAMAGHMKRQYWRTGYPGRIFANYRIEFLDPNWDYYHAYLIEDVQEFPDWFEKGYLVADEIQSFATSRRSMSKSNVNTSAFLTQIRHREIDAAFTTQFPQTIDYQVLLQVDLFIRVATVKKYPNGFPMIVRLEKHDYWGQWTGHDYRKPWPPRSHDADQISYMYIPLSLAGGYSTNQIVASVYWDADVRDRVNEDEEEKMGGDSAWYTGAQAAINRAQDEIEANPGVRYDSVADLLSRLPAGKFNIRTVLARAKSVVGIDTIANASDLAAFLKENGFTVERKSKGTGMSYVAEREAQPE